MPERARRWEGAALPPEGGCGLPLFSVSSSGSLPACQAHLPGDGVVILACSVRSLPGTRSICSAVAADRWSLRSGSWPPTGTWPAAPWADVLIHSGGAVPPASGQRGAHRGRGGSPGTAGALGLREPRSGPAGETDDDRALDHFIRPQAPFRNVRLA